MSARPTTPAPAPGACRAALQGGIAGLSGSRTPVESTGLRTPEKPGATSARPRVIGRRARPEDAHVVYALIAHYTAQGVLLPRSETEIREHVDHFLVLAQAGYVVGCVALESYGTDLAEIRSLAVDPALQGRGLGARLVRFALAVARRRKIARVFAVTHAPEFFLRLGFRPTTRQALPEKIERDCRTCPKQKTCALSAIVFDVLPRRAALPILETRPIAAPA